MAALGAYEEGAHLVRVYAGAFRAGRKRLVHVPILVVACVAPAAGRRRGPAGTQEGPPRGTALPFALFVVELRGLEPLTPCMPCRCATSCATAPNSFLPVFVFPGSNLNSVMHNPPGSESNGARAV